MPLSTTSFMAFVCRQRSISLQTSHGPESSLHICTILRLCKHGLVHTQTHTFICEQANYIDERTRARVITVASPSARRYFLADVPIKGRNPRIKVFRYAPNDTREVVAKLGGGMGFHSG